MVVQQSEKAPLRFPMHLVSETVNHVHVIQMSTQALIVVQHLVREVVQFILIVYSALEENLPYWTASTTKMR